MVYHKVIEGKFVKLRSITQEDAEFSYNLRRDPQYVNIMGQPAESLEAQRSFIEWQMKEPDDYYFVVLNNKNEKIGLIGVYAIEGSCGETGREINTGAPYETMETQILLNEFCRDVLQLTHITYVVYGNNIQNIKLNYNKGIKPERQIIRSGVPSYEYCISIEENTRTLDKARKMIEKLWKKGL